MESFCIACARFTAGDKLGELLAVAATAPYFVVYHIAVIVHSRRELHMVFAFVGALLITALSSAVKKVLKQPRPSATCALLGNCHKHGMPSSHTAVMTYAATLCLLLWLHRQQAQAKPAPAACQAKPGLKAAKLSSTHQSVLAAAVRLLEVCLLAALAAAVGYGRVYLGYHTPAQVAAGAALGAGFAALWWQLTLAACQHWSAQLLRWVPLLRALHFRNTLGCPDVHAAEVGLWGGSNVSVQEHRD